MKQIIIDTEITDLKEVIKALNNGFDTIVKNSSRLEGMVKANHQDVLKNGKKIDGVNQRLDGLINRFNKLDNRLSKFEDRVDNRFDNMNSNMKKIMQHLGIENDEIVSNENDGGKDN